MNVIENLLIVQQHDIKIREMERELKDLPARKSNDQAKLDKYEKALNEAKEKLKVVQTEIKQIEGDINSCREKITKYRQQQLELKTNKEFKAMEEEVKSVEADIRRHEDRELVQMQELEAAKAVVQEKEAILKEQHSLISVDIKVWDERAAGINEELTKIKALRAAAVKGIDANWLSRYERVFKGKDKSLVPLEDGVCGGCHMKLPPATVHEARRHTTVTACAYCGRLLY